MDSVPAAAAAANPNPVKEGFLKLSILSVIFKSQNLISEITKNLMHNLISCFILRQIYHGENLIIKKGVFWGFLHVMLVNDIWLFTNES